MPIQMTLFGKAKWPKDALKAQRRGSLEKCEQPQDWRSEVLDSGLSSVTKMLQDQRNFPHIPYSQFFISKIKALE